MCPSMGEEPPSTSPTATRRFSAILSEFVYMDRLDMGTVERCLRSCARRESPEHEDIIIALVIPRFRDIKYPDGKLIQLELDELKIVSRGTSRHLMKRFWTMLMDEQGAKMVDRGQEVARQRAATPSKSRSPSTFSSSSSSYSSSRSLSPPPTDARRHHQVKNGLGRKSQALDNLKDLYRSHPKYDRTRNLAAQDSYQY